MVTAKFTSHHGGDLDYNSSAKGKKGKGTKDKKTRQANAKDEKRPKHTVKNEKQKPEKKVRPARVVGGNLGDFRG